MKRKRGISSNNSKYTNTKRQINTYSKLTSHNVQETIKNELKRKNSLQKKEMILEDLDSPRKNLIFNEFSNKSLLKKDNRRNKSTVDKANNSKNKVKSPDKEIIKKITTKIKAKTPKSSKSKLAKLNDTATNIFIEKEEQSENSNIITVNNIFPLDFNIMNGSLLGPKCIRLGLCCMNNYLRALKQTIFCSRSITLATYRSKGKSEAISKASKNIIDIKKLLLWNKAHYIDCLRLSSDMFPHYTNIALIEKNDRYDLSFARKDLKEAGDLAKKLGHRITMHPGPYNVVGTPNEQAFEKTIEDLNMHADILDMMQMDANSIMVVHGGGTYGDKQKTIERWINNFKRLPERVRRRLVLENCEKNFSIIDCLEVNKAIGIPVVFDNHHFECYKLMHPDEKFDDIRTYIKLALDTWVSKGLRPKFHISEQAKDRPIGTHSDFIKNFPDYYIEIPHKYGIGVDIMIEAKAKEAAIFYLYKKHGEHFLSHHKNEIDKENIEELFAFNKEKQMAIECEKCLL